MTAQERRPALVLLVLGVALVGLGLVLGDERLRVLCWILAVPMIVGGAVTIGWGNATREIERIRSSRD